MGHRRIRSGRFGIHGRRVDETLNHINGLTKILINAVSEKVNDSGDDLANMTFENKRIATLKNIKDAGKILASSTQDQVENYKIIFRREDSSTEYPFWNMLNGAMAEAIWHVGQFV